MSTPELTQDNLLASMRRTYMAAAGAAPNTPNPVVMSERTHAYWLAIHRKDWNTCRRMDIEDMKYVGMQCQGEWIGDGDCGCPRLEEEVVATDDFNLEEKASAITIASKRLRARAQKAGWTKKDKDWWAPGCPNRKEHGHD